MMLQHLGWQVVVVENPGVVLQYEDSILSCRPCLVAVLQHILICTWHYHSGTFHLYYCSILAPEHHVYTAFSRRFYISRLCRLSHLTVILHYCK